MKTWHHCCPNHLYYLLKELVIAWHNIIAYSDRGFLPSLLPCWGSVFFFSPIWYLPPTNNNEWQIKATLKQEPFWGLVTQLAPILNGYRKKILWKEIISLSKQISSVVSKCFERFAIIFSLQQALMTFGSALLICPLTIPALWALLNSVLFFQHLSSLCTQLCLHACSNCATQPVGWRLKKVSSVWVFYDTHIV